jgi:ABC-type sulfate/molybdate transport systems ATPase subunit
MLPNEPRGVPRVNDRRALNDICWILRERRIGFVFQALDAGVRKDLRKWLRELHRRTGHTTLFVPHDPDEAFELGDRIAILDQGRIEQVGTAAEILENPATAFIDSFIEGIARREAQARDFTKPHVVVSR